MDNLKILFIGNSFAVDTTDQAAQVAKTLGVKKVKLGTLYAGGCAIGMHYEHATKDIPLYIYYENEGDGWKETYEYKISDAIKSDEWDWIVLNHGTAGTNRYTSPECYEKLAPLIEYVRSLAPKGVKIAYSLTWMGEPYHDHHEIKSYNGDTATMRKNMVEVTKQTVLKCDIDRIIPTGTAIENARTSKIGLLTRDGYHLSLGVGRYIAALTFISTLTGLAIDHIDYAPEGISEYEKKVAIESVNNAKKTIFDITKSVVE